MIVVNALISEATTSGPTLALPNPPWPQRPPHPQRAEACDNGDGPEDQAPSPAWPRVFPGL
jgi:hypothetical protein